MMRIILFLAYRIIERVTKHLTKQPHVANFKFGLYDEWPPAYKPRQLLCTFRLTRSQGDMGQLGMSRTFKTTKSKPSIDTYNHFNKYVYILFTRK